MLCVSVQNCRLLVLLLVTFVYLPVEAFWEQNTSLWSHYGDYHLFAKETSWWHSQYSCREDLQGRLFYPKDNDIPISVLDKMTDNELYWIGGLQSLSWRWTENNASIYNNIGNIWINESMASIDYIWYNQSMNYTWYNQSTNNTWYNQSMNYTYLMNNSAFECHYNCFQSDNTTRYFALMGRLCYCLTFDSYNISRDILEAINSTGTLLNPVRCPGNFDDVCGNITYASVYQIDDVRLDLNTVGRCAYARKYQQENDRNETVLHLTMNCSQELSMAYQPIEDRFISDNCVGDICVTKDWMSDWEAAFTASRKTLLRVTEQNLENLTKAMELTDNDTDLSHLYWIGLRQHQRWMWIHGEDIEPFIVRQFDTDYSISVRYCLALRKTAFMVEYVQRPCEDALRSICHSSDASGGMLHTLPKHMSGVAIILTVSIVIGILVALAVFVLLFYQFRKRNSYKPCCLQAKQSTLRQRRLRFI